MVKLLDKVNPDLPKLKMHTPKEMQYECLFNLVESIIYMMNKFNKYRHDDNDYELNFFQRKYGYLVQFSFDDTATGERKQADPLEEPYSEYEKIKLDHPVTYKGESISLDQTEVHKLTDFIESTLEKVEQQQ